MLKMSSLGYRYYYNIVGLNLFTSSSNIMRVSVRHLPATKTVIVLVFFISNTAVFVIYSMASYGRYKLEIVFLIDIS